MSVCERTFGLYTPAKNSNECTHQVEDCHFRLEYFYFQLQEDDDPSSWPLRYLCTPFKLFDSHNIIELQGAIQMRELLSLSLPLHFTLNLLVVNVK